MNKLWRLIVRDQAMIIAIVVAAATCIGTFAPSFGGVDVRLQAVFAALVAIGFAWKARPLAPALITGLLAAVLDLMARFGFHLGYQQVGGLDTFFILAIAYITRSRVTPKADPAPGHAVENP
jgi:hypothetical protein